MSTSFGFVHNQPIANALLSESKIEHRSVFISPLRRDSIVFANNNHYQLTLFYQGHNPSKGSNVWFNLFTIRGFIKYR
jgi:hypothetical protein